MIGQSGKMIATSRCDLTQPGIMNSTTQKGRKFQVSESLQFTQIFSSSI